MNTKVSLENKQQAAGFNLQGIVHYDVIVPLSFARGIIRP